MAMTQREKELRAAGRASRKSYDTQIENAVDLLLALHLAGFRTLFLESVLMDVAPFEVFAYLWLDDNEIGPERMDTLYAIATDHDASVALAQPLGPNTPSKIRVWPSREG